MMNDSLVEASDLKKLGLTEYQARSLLALMTIGAGTPRDVARESGIPYPSAYDSLRTLSEKGWIESASTRPAIFRAREPKLMKEKVTSDLARLFDNLEKQYRRIRDETSKLQLIYTITGRQQVRDKIIEMLRSAKGEALLVIPSMTLQTKNDPIFKFLNQKARNTRLKILTDDHESLGTLRAEVRVRKSVLAVDLLVDQSKALISLPDLSACGWIESPAIASHFGQFLDLMWMDSISPEYSKGESHG